jgi:membrane protease YdiL (CAAX protease family)
VHRDLDDRDPWYASRTPPRTLAAVACLLVLPLFVLAGSVVQALHPGFGIWFTELFIFLGAPFVLVRLSGRNPWAWPGGRPFHAAGAGWGFGVGLLNFFAVVVPLQFVAQLVFPPDWAQAFDSTRIFRDRSPVELVLIATGVTLCAPLAEEYFFRGVLQNALGEARVRARGAIVGVAILFSAFHFDPVGFVARVELGVLFGWLFWRTGSLWPAVFAHAANNLVTTVLFFVALQGGEAAAEQTAREGVLQVVAACAVGMIGLCALLFWLPRRYPKVAARVDPGTTSTQPARLYPTAAPWLVGALLSVALLLAVEGRTVALNWFDLGHPLPPTATEAEREELGALRVRARKGQVPVEVYRTEREAVIERHRDGQAPAPELPPPPSTP